MSSEWMKVMLDEIARKKAAEQEERLEEEQRRERKEGPPATPEAGVIKSAKCAQ